MTSRLPSSPSGSTGCRARPGPRGSGTAVEEAEQLPGGGQRLHYLSRAAEGRAGRRAELAEAGLVERSRIIMEKPFGTDLARAQALNAAAARGLRARSRSSGSTTSSARRRPRTSSRSGSRTACSSRSGTATTSTTSRSTSPRRWGSTSAALLRGHRRLPRHGRHPPLPGARLHRDGAADGARALRDQRGEEQGLPLDGADRARGRRPRPVRRLPRRAGRGAGVRDRDVRRAQVLRRQLALGGGAVLPADRQAAGRGRADHLDRLQGAAAVDVPGGLGRRRQRARPPDLRPRRQVADVVVVLRQAARARA